MRVFPKAIVLTTKSHFHVKRTYASIRGLVVRTITSGKARISAIHGLALGKYQITPALSGSQSKSLKLREFIYYPALAEQARACSFDDSSPGCLDTFHISWLNTEILMPIFFLVGGVNT